MEQKTPEQLRNEFWKSDIERGGGSSLTNMKK